MYLKRILERNRTRIQYLSVADKIYKVTDIDFSNLTLSASECDVQICDVPDGELFKVEDFKEFRVKLHNWQGNVVNLADWKKKIL